MATQVQTTTTKVPDAKALMANITNEGRSEVDGAYAIIRVMDHIAAGTAAGVFVDQGKTGKDAYAAFQAGRKAKLGKAYVAPSEDAMNSQESKLTAPMRLMLGKSNGGDFKGLGLETGLKVYSQYVDHALNVVVGGRKQTMIVDMVAKAVSAKKALPLSDEKIVDAIKAAGGNPTLDSDGRIKVAKAKKIAPAKALAETLRGIAADFGKMRDPKKTAKENSAREREKTAFPKGLYDTLGDYAKALNAYADGLDPKK